MEMESVQRFDAGVRFTVTFTAPPDGTRTGVEQVMLGGPRWPQLPVQIRW